MKRISLLTALVCVVAGVVVGASGATGTLDQSQPGASAGTEALTTDFGQLGQTFTASKSGALDRVDLYLVRINDPGNLTVEIHSTSSGVPSGTVLASATVSSSDVPEFGPGWVPVTFATPAPSVAGAQYAVVLSAAGPLSGSVFVAWGAALGDPYAGGQAWNAFFGSWFDAYPGVGLDRTFQTYVTPADSDGDGVPDEMDIEISSPPESVAFSDANPAALGAGTYGVITPNGLTLSVEDLNDDPASPVRITASGSGGPLSVVACGESITWTLESGDSVLVDCGSVILKADAGDGVEGHSGSGTVSVPTGVSAEFDLVSNDLAVSTVTWGSVTVAVDLPVTDATVVFGEGSAGSVNMTTASVTGATGDVTMTVGGEDVPVGAGGLNVIQRGSGSDTISGTAGPDLIVDSGGANTIRGNGGDDTIIAGTGNDTIDGGDGNDTINAGNGNNNVKGGAGDDSLSAGTGNDTVDGGSGFDSCNAGIGKNNVKDCES